MSILAGLVSFFSEHISDDSKLTSGQEVRLIVVVVTVMGIGIVTAFLADGWWGILSIAE